MKLLKILAMIVILLLLIPFGLLAIPGVLLASLLGALANVPRQPIQDFKPSADKAEDEIVIPGVS